MALVKLVAVVLTAALLCGASCRPVYSERPVGSFVVNLSRIPVAWSGVWCAQIPVGKAAPPLASQIEHPEQREGLSCWLVSVADEANGVLTLRPLFRDDETLRFITIYVRWPAPSQSEPTVGTFAREAFFFSEEDALLKGSYLWALAYIYAQDQLLVWMTEQNREAFVDLVTTGKLPGRTVEKRKGRSEVVEMATEQTVILGDLKDEHLSLLGERPGALFDFLPWVVQRLPPTEPIPFKSDHKLDPSDFHRVD
jgi:hypothetical protein